MPIPSVIEIMPLASPVQAAITVPGSKSITNRALVLAALAQGETVLEGALWSEDTQVMVDCLRVLGFTINVTPADRDPGNRVITVYGERGKIGPGGTLENPLELYVGNAGTVARFLAAMVCLGQGIYRLHGTPRMHERPQEPLFGALRELGYCLDSVNNRLPADIHGDGPHPGACCVNLEQSSQFASALMMSAPTGGWQVNVLGVNAEETAYVRMTRRLIRAFPRFGGTWLIEPDASSGSYFIAADFLQPRDPEAARRIQVADWPTSGWQIDARFPEYLPLPKQVSRLTDLGDSILTAMVLAPFAEHPVTFTDLEPLRAQESERVKAVRTQLGRCGVKVQERDDTLTVQPGAVRGATIETYQDHRLAMCFSILGLKVPGMKIKNPACVKKTFPNFYQKLAAPPPDGLGATILNAATKKPVEFPDLFVE